jgi:phage gp37-like protein
MLPEIEIGLVAAIRASALGARLRQVESLPDLDGDSLIGRFFTDAPAAYVALGSFPVEHSRLHLKYGVALVARNSGSQQAARHGDGIAIGLQQMIDSALNLLNGIRVSYGPGNAVSFSVTSCDIVSNEALFQKGVYVAVIQIETPAGIYIEFDESGLADFKVFTADYDIPPHESDAEHAKWLEEPPDHGTSAPDLSDQLNLQE